MKLVFLNFLYVFSAHRVRACPEACDCEGGYVSCGRRNLTSFPQLDTVPVYAKRLTFSNNNIRDIKLSGKNVINHPKLISLFLHHNELTTIPAYKKSVLSGFSGLRWLSVSNNRLQNIADGAFQGLHRLERLHLSDNNIHDITQRTFRGLRQLHRLYLYNNRIEHIASDAFRKLQKLYVLNLSNNLLNKVIFSWFDKLHLLKQIHLDNNRISSFEPDDFSWPSSLEQLYLHNNKIKTIPPLPIQHCNKKVKFTCKRTELYLQGNNIYCGCRRPEHDKTILNMTLPVLNICCADVVKECPEELLHFTDKNWKNIQHFDSSQFFHSYMEGPVCKRPSIEIHPMNEGPEVCVVKGDPKPVIHITREYHILPRLAKDGVKVPIEMTIICEASNEFGKTKQISSFCDSCENSTKSPLNMKVVTPINPNNRLYATKFTTSNQKDRKQNSNTEKPGHAASRNSDNKDTSRVMNIHKSGRVEETQKSGCLDCNPSSSFRFPVWSVVALYILSFASFSFILTFLIYLFMTNRINLNNANNSDNDGPDSLSEV